MEKSRSDESFLRYGGNQIEGYSLANVSQFVCAAYCVDPISITR
ncbi:MAG: hypothetical protein P8M80_15205 [Pirellulaceae bacterium]|nr:hypothetical protein [Pirellulaceae bacterium]